MVICLYPLSYLSHTQNITIINTIAILDIRDSILTNRLILFLDLNVELPIPSRFAQIPKRLLQLLVIIFDNSENRERSQSAILRITIRYLGI